MEVNGQLYPRGKSPRYSLDRRLGWPQSRSGHYREEKNLAPTGNRTLAIQPVAGDVYEQQILHIKQVSATASVIRRISVPDI
jgi:hypothetical protein